MMECRYANRQGLRGSVQAWKFKVFQIIPGRMLRGTGWKKQQTKVLR
jgi:hypothetical protein